MITTEDIARYAAAVAAGDMAADELNEICGGDESILTDVLSLVSSMGAGAIAADMTSSLINSNEITQSICDVGDSVIGGVTETVGSIFDFEW